MREDDTRKLSKNLQQELRKRAVLAVQRGKTKTEISECYGVSRKIVTGLVR